MPHPAVSICVPTWNGVRHLRAALESALGQTHQDFELLVVDDASTDDTLGVVASFADARISIHRNAHRLGIPRNWNRCLELARGRYVKFLFQDDLLHPLAVARLVTALEATPRAAFAFSRRAVRYERGVSAEGARAHEIDRFQSTLADRFEGLDLVRGGLHQGWDLALNVVGEPSFVLLRRDAVHRSGGFDVRLSQLVDWDLWLRLARDGPAVFVSDTLGVFRVHAGSQSAANHRRLRNVVECIRILDRIRRHFGPRLAAVERAQLVAAECRYAVHLAGESLRSIPRARTRRAVVTDG